MGEEVEGGAWIVRVYVKPFIDWIWGGCMVMALGGLMAVTDRRYRRRAHSDQVTIVISGQVNPMLSQI
jgi:cytochrome c-type biogenesis protein CcmF